ncbi:MAG: hypothetical protein QXX08_08475 [Candidatus Bathyarchaeia archaeon]
MELCYHEYVGQLTKVRRWIFLILLATLSILLTVFYFLTATPSLRFPDQEQYKSETDFREALISVSELWEVPEASLIIFAVHVEKQRAKSVAILDPKTFSSAVVWIPEPGIKHEHSVALLDHPEHDFHLLSQYSPRSTLEKTISKIYYTQVGWAESHQAVIVNIRGNPLSKVIWAYSLSTGKFGIPVLFILPIYSYAINVDIR